MPNVSFGLVTIGGVKYVTATYNITDGGILDDDGSANGVIEDPVGLANVVVGAPNTGSGKPSTDNSYLTILLSVGLVSLAISMSVCNFGQKQKIV